MEQTLSFSEKTIEGRRLRMKRLKDKLIDLHWIVNHRKIGWDICEKRCVTDIMGIIFNNIGPESRKFDLG